MVILENIINSFHDVFIVNVNTLLPVAVKLEFSLPLNVFSVKQTIRPKVVKHTNTSDDLVNYKYA